MQRWDESPPPQTDWESVWMTSVAAAIILLLLYIGGSV